MKEAVVHDTEFEQRTGIPVIHRHKSIGLLRVLFPELKRVILYGSRARGKFSEYSDIDLALDCGGKIQNHRRLLEAEDVLNILRTAYQCDVVDFHRAQGLFLTLIEQDGVVIWKA